MPEGACYRYARLPLSLRLADISRQRHTLYMFDKMCRCCHASAFCLSVAVLAFRAGDIVRSLYGEFLSFRAEVLHYVSLIRFDAAASIRLPLLPSSLQMIRVADFDADVISLIISRRFFELFTPAIFRYAHRCQALLLDVDIDMRCFHA